jgi:hypothetical protein
MDWDYWRRVLIVTLVILLIIIAYRKLLRIVGGKERFNNKYAYLAPIKKDEQGNTVVVFELPEDGVVSLSLSGDNENDVVIMEKTELKSGKHEITLSSAVKWHKGQVLSLHTHNQKIERKLE